MQYNKNKIEVLINSYQIKSFYHNFFYIVLKKYVLADKFVAGRSFPTPDLKQN